jgi:hypothetical protein
MIQLQHSNMSEVAEVGSGCPYRYCQLLANSCTIYIDNIPQNCWLLTYSIHSNFTIICTATQSEVWKAIVVNLKLMCLYT